MLVKSYEPEKRCPSRGEAFYANPRGAIFFSKRLKAGEECPLKEKKDVVQIHAGAERKRKEGRYINNPLGGEKEKEWEIRKAVRKR